MSATVIHIDRSKHRPKGYTHTDVRPHTIHYYGSVKDRPGDFSRTTHAASPRGAVRAAFWRLLIGQYRAATVCGLDGETLFRLMRKGRTVEVFGWFDKHTFLES
jgi:hypothetical protein